MKFLALETSTLLGGIAIADESEGLIAESRLSIRTTFSERLMTEIDHVMKQAGIALENIDVFAVSIGPGSFTGLRIGLSTTKGFAFATGRPVVSVPSLEAFAWNFPYCCYPVCTLLDARKKQVYAAVFLWNEDGFIRIIEEVPISIQKLMENLASLSLPLNVGGERGLSGKKILFAGEGAILYRDQITDSMRDRAVFAPPEKMVPSPANVALLGMKKASRGEFSDPISLVPLYIRRSEAENKKHG
ncbi:MAG: tRNA (adenosine(37)-N6)-threonylcarbamoyltransferase complex dimerization subunit type 1 TsaB [Thermodesulfovibrionales bacterium]|nr:tRNA (adenosine(37)-N6)-threonylcarbamoyltransferase complex dimerization subunit type 1 TsaB [Thermodesulfovibrionales bacterium]